MEVTFFFIEKNMACLGTISIILQVSLFNVSSLQAEHELSIGVSARDRLNQETEYAFSSPQHIIIQPFDR